MNHDDLHDLLTRATDAIESPGLATGVLPIVRKRRKRRRGALAAAGATAAVAVVLVGVTVTGEGKPQPAPKPPTTVSTPTPAPDPARGAVKPRWDPFTIVDAPLRDSVLPQHLEPPASAPTVTDQAMEAAVLAWPLEGRDLLLLGTDGEWRSAPGTADAVAEALSGGLPALSPDGHQVAMSTISGIRVVDATNTGTLRSGLQRTIPWPAQISENWDIPPGLLWLPDGQGWIVQHWQGTWVVEPDGEAYRPPFGGTYQNMSGLAVDDDNTLVERRWYEHDFDKRDLRVWRDGEVESRVEFHYWGDNDLATQDGLLAMVGGADYLPGDGGPMVFDAATGQLLAYLPITDPNAYYTDGGYLGALGFLDPDTVLLHVTPVDIHSSDNRNTTSHLAAWHLDSGDFERLTSGDIRMRSIVVAPDVLDGTE
jgi:hypothetical protein